MSTATGDQRSDRLSSSGTRPPEPEHLPCPRCDSANTKFCYYNNYNLSQPRHFCKACRRYWTRGGTLRNVPVGGGTRKSSHKRPRTNQPSGPNITISTASSSSETVIYEPQNLNTVHQMVPVSDSGHHITGSLAACFDVNLNEAVPEALSLSSLLTTHAGTGGYMPFGLGFELEPGSTLNGVGYGLGADWPMESACQPNNAGDTSVGSGGGGGGGNGGSGGSSGCNTWQIGGVEGVLGDGDCFGWPDLAISMAGKELK